MQLVIKLVTQILVFYARWVEAKNRGGLKVDTSFVTEFYERTHDENTEFLENRGIKVGTIVWLIHALMSWLNVYSVDSTIVSMTSKTSARAIAEIKLAVLVVGQDNMKAHYSREAGQSTYMYSDEDAQRSIRVAGLGMSQLDPRNTELLRGASLALTGIADGEHPKHDASITAKGKYGNKPGSLFEAPVLLPRWLACVKTLALQCSVFCCGLFAIAPSLAHQVPSGAKWQYAEIWPGSGFGCWWLGPIRAPP
jgi:hypothetical protein